MEANPIKERKTYAQKYLEQFIRIDSHIKERMELFDKYRTWNTVCSTDVVINRKKRYSNNDKIADYIVILTELERTTGMLIKQYTSLKYEIERVISQITEQKYRDLLTFRYICGKKWEQVAKAMYYNDIKWLRKLHKRALEQVQFILDKEHSKLNDTILAF